MPAMRHPYGAPVPSQKHGASSCPGTGDTVPETWNEYTLTLCTGEIFSTNFKHNLKSRSITHTPRVPSRKHGANIRPWANTLSKSEGSCSYRGRRPRQELGGKCSSVDEWHPFVGWISRAFVESTGIAFVGSISRAFVESTGVVYLWQSVGLKLKRF